MKIQMKAFLLVAGVMHTASAFTVNHRAGFIGTYQNNQMTSTLSSSLTTRSMSESETIEKESVDPSAAITMPLTFDEMIAQTADASKAAYEQGITRQTIRILLPRDPSSGDLGIYFEQDANLSMKRRAFDLTENVALVPPDETWQGGIMQLYRACAPTCTEILRKIAGDGRDTGGVPARIVEDRSIDESGVDGCGLLMTQGSSSKDDVSCFIQPTQEIIRAIESISTSAGDRLVMMVNPQWRNIDDALDTASKSGGIFGSFASFLGGKGGVLNRLEELGYTNTYCIEGYVCKGGNIRLVKRFDSDWVVFAENDSLTDYIRVGTSKNRPTYQDCDKMLDEKGISLKYARDIGLAPKLE